jgi:serine/threonine protein kinase
MRASFNRAHSRQPEHCVVPSAKICPTCNVEYPETERFCPKDGAALQLPRGGSTDLVGSIIAERYHIIERLGAGGMGRVYLAEHVKMGRQCAIKVLHPAMAGDADAIGRFNREAANASRIDHPNVAAIYDFGETQDGLLYLAMQYIEGETLTQVMQSRGALTPLRASDITRQAAEGLHAAHAIGIVHRDLKPDNIMVSTDADGLDSVKVVDFGIAKATGEVAQGVTRTGIVVGTPEYMSPEQLAGEPVDGHSDQYSLAMVAFNMLTGELPFPAASTGTMVVMRLTERPRTLAAVRPEIAWPRELEAVMAKALDREPALRYPTTRDFAHAFHGAAAMMVTRALPARPPVAGETSSSSSAPTRVAAAAATSAAQPAPISRVRRNRWALVGIAALVLVASAVAGRGAIRTARARRALEQGIRAFRDGQREVARDRFTAASIGLPDDPAPHVFLSRLARESNDLATASGEGVKAVRLAPNNGPALRELATTMFAMQNYEAARAFYVRAIRADTADHTAQGYLGCSLIQLGRPEEGQRWIQRAGSGTWSACR